MVTVIFLKTVPAKFENCWLLCLLELVEGKGYAV